MASDAYIKAAMAANRKRVILMEIEDADAIVESVDTTAEWAACTLNDCVAESGRVFPFLNMAFANYGSLLSSHEYYSHIVATAGSSLFLHSVAGGVRICAQLTDKETSQGLSLSAFPLDITVQAQIVFRDAVAGTEVGRSEETTVTLHRTYRDGTTHPHDVDYGEQGITEEYYPECFFQADINISAAFEDVSVASAGTVYAELSLTRGGYVNPLYADVYSIATTGLIADCTPAAADVTTTDIDLGETPASSPYVYFDDLTPYGSSIAYTLYGGDVSPTNNLGTVVDGQAVTAYRYYRVVANFVSTTGARPSLSRVAINSGAFKYFGTHQDQPFSGVLPYLTAKPVGTLTSKIDLKKPAPTSGQANVKLVWTAETGDLVKTGYLKNKYIRLQQGFVGLPYGDFEPLFTGRFYDYSADPAVREFDFTVRGPSKRFDGVKIPEEIEADDGSKAAIPYEFSGNIIDAITNLLDQMGIPGREIDSSAFTSVRDSHYTGTDWNIEQNITKPTKAFDLIGELCELAGLNIIEMPDGRLTPIYYDASAAAVANLDARDFRIGKISGGQNELLTQQVIYYDPNSEDPGEDSDNYDSVRRYVNSAALSAWGETKEQSFYSKYTSNLTALNAVAARRDSWFATPHFKIPISAVAPRHMDVWHGEVVALDNAMLPVESADWGDLSSGDKFLVLSRNHDPFSGELKFELYDLQTSGTAGAGVVGTDLVLSGSANPSGATNAYTCAGGTSPFSWATTAGALDTTSGTTVNLDVSALVTGTPVTIRVTGQNGSVAKRLVVNNGGSASVDWADLTDTGGTKPEDNATNNTGDLADLDAADWSTQVTGTGKPDNNADVTGDNTAADTNAVGGTAATTVLSGIAQALSDAADAQSTADGKITTFYQASAPTADGVGDFWIDTDDDNKLYRWSGSAWVSVQDGNIAQALSDAADAQSTADGKITTFYTTSIPTAEGVGDLWFNTSTGLVKRWSGSAWVDYASYNTGALADLDTVDTDEIEDEAATVAKRYWASGIQSLSGSYTTIASLAIGADDINVPYVVVASFDICPSGSTYTSGRYQFQLVYGATLYESPDLKMQNYESSGTYIDDVNVPFVFGFTPTATGTLYLQAKNIYGGASQAERRLLSLIGSKK